ncbi:hypothetical protein P167DRAFT_495277 [Morchella conica CCBAS932]|uniref:TRAF-type domain-containing protein n=2 Tax=Morchella sect. Distantes TaxID=1051054 RepID=A0A3N4KBC4_9PEZI|nr:hypothetical protein P167DRAFT_495277 [Morchella conica CCBAS932]
MVASLVNDLLVLCPNAELGCPTTCARYLLAGHLRDACGFVEVKCSGCDDLVLRKDAAEEDCMHQVLECAYCFESFRRIDMEVHESHCPQILAECPYCTTEQTRATITAHTAACPSAPTLCPASTIGCPWAGARRDLPAHTSLCAFTLLRPVLAAHTARLETLELENRALRKKIDILLPPGRDDDGPVYDDQTIQLLTEQEHLRGDVERLSASLGEMEIKQSMLLMNETLRTKEEMAGMRAAINGMRMQIHWLLTARLQRAGPGPGERAEAGAGSVRRVTEGGAAGSQGVQGDRVKL